VYVDPVVSWGAVGKKNHKTRNKQAKEKGTAAEVRTAELVPWAKTEKSLRPGVPGMVATKENKTPQKNSNGIHGS